MQCERWAVLWPDKHLPSHSRAGSAKAISALTSAVETGARYKSQNTSLSSHTPPGTLTLQWERGPAPKAAQEPLHNRYPFPMRICSCLFSLSQNKATCSSKDWTICRGTKADAYHSQSCIQNFLISVYVMKYAIHLGVIVILHLLCTETGALMW